MVRKAPCIEDFPLVTELLSSTAERRIGRTFTSPDLLLVPNHYHGGHRIRVSQPVPTVWVEQTTSEASTLRSRQLSYDGMYSVGWVVNPSLRLFLPWSHITTLAYD